MGRGPCLTEREQERILTLHGEGNTYEYISKNTGRSQNVICNLLKDPEKYGHNYKGSKPRKLSTRKLNLIGRKSREWAVGSRTMKPRLEAYDISVSDRYLRNLLRNKLGYGFFGPKSEISLTRKQKINRKKWGEKMLENSDDYQNAFFVDEVFFTKDGNVKKTRRWWPLDNRGSMPTALDRQKGGGGVMVFGGISIDTIGPICLPKGKINADKYISMLKEAVVPVLRNKRTGTYELEANQKVKRRKLVQDNASVHNAGKTKKFLELQNVETLPWPVKSPDWT